MADALTRPRGKESLANILRKRAGIEGVKAGLLRELTPDAVDDPTRLVRAIKNLPLTLLAPRPLEEAISSAGGVAFEALDERSMARAVPVTLTVNRRSRLRSTPATGVSAAGDGFEAGAGSMVVVDFVEDSRCRREAVIHVRTKSIMPGRSAPSGRPRRRPGTYDP